MSGEQLRARPHQAQAVTDLMAAFTQHDRAQLVMACGTGKTLVGRWLAERREAGCTVVFLPSLGLVAQTLAEWRSATGWAFEALIVCSDRTTVDGAQERLSLDGGDVPAPFWMRHRALVTTSPRDAAVVMERRRPDRPLVVFSTYHSARVAAAAAARAGTVFDLAIADEAHHLAGRPRRDFRVVLTEELRATKRVFMTATQVVTGQCAGVGGGGASLSMADERLFGPVAYRLDFAAAIGQGLLSDYRVLIFEVSGDVSPDPVAALMAAAGLGLTRVLSFHGRVAKARGFAAAIDGQVLPDGRRIVARAVAGTDPAARRARVLRQLEEADPSTLAVVASARCLAEGVNIPAVDGVLFADPRNSEVDVVQAAGRAMRRASGKTHGQILIPVCVNPDLDDDTTLSTSSFAAAWRILRSLRQVDPQLEAELKRFTYQPPRRGTDDGSRGPARLWFRLPSLRDLGSLAARLVESTSSAWDEFFAELEAFAAEHGHSRPPASHRLHAWCDRQRRAHRIGLLLPDRAAALRSLPGWVWDLDQQKWLEQCGAATAAGGRCFDLTDPELMGRPIPHPNSRTGVTTTGRWCALQRILARRGDLDPERRDRLNLVPGWTWWALNPTDTACVDLLAEYVAWKQDANVPAGYVDDDQPLGDWLVTVRRRRALDVLDQALLDEIGVVTPGRSAEGALAWRRGETLWSLGLEALHRFVAREGTAKVPDQYVEQLPDTAVQLSVWCRRQRHAHRYGHLVPDRVALLEAVEGWRWEIQPAPRVRLDIGDTRHGSRTGYVKGCRCAPCTEANRVDQAAREEVARAGGPSTDLVPATQARGRLRILEAQGASLKGMARATDLNTKTITDILDGSRQRILPATEKIVLALTINQVRAAAAPGTLVPAQQTWRLVNELTSRGWPKVWIAREIGQRAALQIGRDDVAAATAAKIAALYDRLDGIDPPPRRARAPMPPLEEILADQTTPSVAA